MRPPAQDLLQQEYRQRISQVINHIHCHYGENLNLDNLAKMAGMSKFHFHRIFKTVAGETAGAFIRQWRVQESLRRLILEPHKSITEVALECGFSSSQNFAKMLKSYHGKTPFEVRQEYNWRAWCEKMKALKGKSIEEIKREDEYIYECYCKTDGLAIGEILDLQTPPDAKVTRVPDMHVAYIRSIGPPEKTFPANVQRLMEWAWPRGLCREGMMVFSLMHSNFKITPPEKRVYDTCITVPEQTVPDRWVSVRKIREGLFAVHHCELEPAQNVREQWMNLILNWLIPSIYQLDNRPPFQRFCNDPETHPQKHLLLEFYLPIKPLYD